MNNENEVNVIKHEITLLSHIKQIKGILYGMTLGGVVIAIATHELNVPIYVRILLPIILGLVLGLDAIILHFRYWLLSRNTVLEISDECIEISIN